MELDFSYKNGSMEGHNEDDNTPIDWDLYDKYFINGFGHLTNIASKITGKFDFNGIDQIIVDGNGKIVNLLGKIFRKIQTGRLQNYILYVTAGVIILMIIQSF